MNLLLLDYSSPVENLTEKLGDRLVAPVWIEDDGASNERMVKHELWKAYCALKEARTDLLMEPMRNADLADKVRG